MRIKNLLQIQQNVEIEVVKEPLFELASNLGEIHNYLKDENVQECLYYEDAEIYAKEIYPGFCLVDVYNIAEDDGYTDEKELLLRVVAELEKVSDEHDFDEGIIIQPYYSAKENTAHNLNVYLCLRRNILAGINDAKKFSPFMKTCFINCIFALDVERGIKDVDNFRESLVRKEIVRHLSVLNDKAIIVYEKHKPNFNKMYEELSGLNASPDRAEDVQCFAFKTDNNTPAMISCSPHTKLIHKGSNLRIYFSWCNSEVGSGKKTLIGHIGGHLK